MIKAIKSENLSTCYESRYILVDIETGEIIDDAQGYGFKTAKRAYAAYAYKNRDKSEELQIHNFLKSNYKIVEMFYDEVFYDIEDNISRKSEDILNLIFDYIKIESKYSIKKILYGIKHYDKIEKDLKKHKYDNINI